MIIKLDLIKDETDFWKGLVSIIFRFTASTFFILVIIEYLFAGFVTNYFNPIWLLIIAVISGIIQVTRD